MVRRHTKEDFIKIAREKHGSKYDYSKVEYKNNRTKVIIICPRHGEFYQIPICHKKGGCIECGKKPMKLEKYIERVNIKHNNKYDYSKVEYKNAGTKIIIICPIHGEFKQRAMSHLLYGCNKCAIDENAIKRANKPAIFINKANKLYGDKYDYSKIDYINSYTNILIVCPDHGEYHQRPDNHMKGYGCGKCKSVVIIKQNVIDLKDIILDKKYDNKDEKTKRFIIKSISRHGYKYDYSNTTYIRNHDKVIIICITHGEFPQTPGNHKGGSGCKQCAIELNSKKKTKSSKDFYNHCSKNSWGQI